MNDAISLTPPASCPAHSKRRLSPDDELVFPRHKQTIVQYSRADDGGLKELHLYYGDKEISFDEPDLFVFGENLAKQARFVAQSVLAWDERFSANTDWQRLAELLEQLLEAGVLQYADAVQTAPQTDVAGSRPSPLPTALTTQAHTWHEAVAITTELTGRALELGYLECVIPIFRVAHLYLDAEARQVGEANVFPPALRLDIATEWRTCTYAGSRFEDPRPMNVTALKSMRTYWQQMMAALLLIRDAYLQRFPEARLGWTVGGLEALSTLVLAVPSYQLMKAQDPLGNGQLHPALSSMFRVTDGLRMVSHQMMFVPVGEPTVAYHTPISSQAVYEYSERNYAFTSDYGVCAGPKAMIEEFLQVLIDGVPAKGSEAVVLDAEVVAALAELDAAFAYSLYGLQVHAAVFSIWPVMTRTYVQLGEILAGVIDVKAARMQQFEQHLERQLQLITTQSYHAQETWRSHREQTYADIYAHCAVGLGHANPEKSLTEQIAPVMEACHEPVLVQLRAFLAGYFGDIAAVEQLSRCLLNYFLQVQAILRVATTAQSAINSLLARPLPQHAFTAAQINIHNLLQGGDSQERVAFLTDWLEEVLGLQVVISQDRIEIGG